MCKDNVMTVTGRNLRFIAKEVPDLKQNALKLNTAGDEEFTHKELDNTFNFIVTS